MTTSFSFTDNNEHYSGQVTDEQKMQLIELSCKSLEQLQNDGIFVYSLSPSLSNNRKKVTVIDAFVNTNSDDLTIYTHNLVGFICYKGLKIDIRSRFASPDSADGADSNDFFLHYLMLKTNEFNFIEQYYPFAKTDSALDFLPFLFTKFLTNALNQGLFKQYQRHHYNNSRPRGTIDIAAHLKLNMPFTGKIAYSTREFSYDNPITELIRHTIESIRNKPELRDLLYLTRTTQEAVKQIEAATPSYSPNNLKQVLADNARPLQHPYFTAYGPLQYLCKSILRNEMMRYANTTQQDDEIYGVICDISYLWEEYLTTLLTVKPLNFIHPNNTTGERAIYLAKPHAFRSFPDFYLPSSSVSNNTDPDTKQAALLVVDAKYKRYAESGVQRDDIHQIMAYMYAQKAPNALLISPMQADDKSIDIINPQCYTLLGYGGNISVLAMPIPQKAESFAGFCKAMAKAEQSLISALQELVLGQ